MTLLLAKDLRNAVLQAAIEGKLTDRFIKDGNAKKYKQLFTDKKNNLIENKIIRSEKESLDIDEAECPFELPNNWEWFRFQDICQTLTCGYASTPKYVDKSIGMPFISAKNVKPYKFITDNYNYIEKELFYSLRQGCCPSKGDILLTRVGAGIGEAAIIDTDLDFAIYVSLTLIKLIDYSLINNKYILYWLNSPLGIKTSRNNTLGKGASQGNLNVNNVRNYLIPLPPIEEQARIVARVDELMAEIDEYEKIENQLVELKKNFPGDMKAAILQAAMQGKLTEQLKSEVVACRKLLSTKNYSKIEELYDLPDNWINAHLEDLTNSIATKQYQILESDVCKEGKFPVISQSKEYSIGFTNHEDRVFIPSSKIVLFGDHTTVVKIIDHPFVVGADGVKLFECTDFILPKYLYYVLTFNASLISKVGGYSRHYKYLKNKSIPLPPIEEQKRIVEKLDQLLPLCDELERI